MINKISFAGLKGLSSPENKKNLKLLNQVYGKTFLDSAQTVFEKIDELSADKDVFLHISLREGFARDYMEFSITNPEQKVIANAFFKMGSTPEKYGNTKGLLKALNLLKQSFERNFVKEGESSELSELINKYS